MSETFIIIQITVLFLGYLGYMAYLYSQRRKVLKQKQEEKITLIPNYSGNLNVILREKSEEKTKERERIATKIVNQSDEEMIYSIVLPLDIKLIETVNCLLIKGSVNSIAAICDEFSLMIQLPEGFCVQLDDWKLFVLEDIPKSSREDKIVVMPADHWLFMSCKLRDSIYGEDIHPYLYFYEPFTFKKVLDYGIGVEATDYTEFNKEEF